MNKRFEFEEMSVPNRFSVCDKETDMRCMWDKDKFHETKVFLPSMKKSHTSDELKSMMEALTDWIEENLKGLM